MPRETKANRLVNEKKKMFFLCHRYLEEHCDTI